MKSAVEKLRESADEIMARVEEKASQHLEKLMEEPPRGWDQVTVQDKVALAFAGYNSSRSRAKINANAAPKVLAVVAMPAPIASREEWERKAKAIDAKVTDTTLGPALIEAVEEKK